MLVMGMVYYLLEVSRDGSQHIGEGVGLGLWQGLACRTETDQLISNADNCRIWACQQEYNRSADLEVWTNAGSGLVGRGVTDQLVHGIFAIDSVYFSSVCSNFCMISCNTSLAHACMHMISPAVINRADKGRQENHLH